MLARVGGQKNAPVLGTDDDRPTPGGETPRVHVVGEPLGEPDPAGLEALTTVEPASGDCRAATPMTGRGAEEHRGVREGDGTTGVRKAPSGVPSPGVTALVARARAGGRRQQPAAGARPPRQPPVD